MSETRQNEFERFVDRRHVEEMLEEVLGELRTCIVEYRYADALRIVESVKWALEVVQKKEGV